MQTKVQKVCLNCNNIHYRKKFCSNSCKDKFYNKLHPRGFYAKQTDRDVVQREITIDGLNLSEMLNRY